MDPIVVTEIDIDPLLDSLEKGRQVHLQCIKANGMFRMLPKQVTVVFERLHLASAFLKIDHIKRFLEEGDDPHKVSDVIGNALDCALCVNSLQKCHFCANFNRENLLETVLILLRQGVTPSLMELVLTCFFDQRSLIKVTKEEVIELIEAGAEVERKGGISPMEAVAYSSQIELAYKKELYAILMQYGAHPPTEKVLRTAIKLIRVHRSEVTLRHMEHLFLIGGDPNALTKENVLDMLHNELAHDYIDLLHRFGYHFNIYCIDPQYRFGVSRITISYWYLSNHWWIAGQRKRPEEKAIHLLKYEKGPYHSSDKIAECFPKYTKIIKDRSSLRICAWVVAISYRLGGVTFQEYDQMYDWSYKD